MSSLSDGKVKLIAKSGVYKDSAQLARLAELESYYTPSSGSTLAQQAEWERLHASATGDYFVQFDVTPDITESGSAMYGEISDIRGPASILYYQGSPSRTFTLNAKFVSRTDNEAKRCFQQIQTLKSWRMPEDLNGKGGDMRPPTLLYLRGYGDMLRDIPVVMTDISIDLSSEHDFIQASMSSNRGHGTGQSSSVPIICPVSITLKEAHSLDGEAEDQQFGFGAFNILDYRLGRLKGW